MLLPLTFLISRVCLARIGETLDECTARYGPMQKIDNAVGKFYSDYPEHCFTFQNILIRIRFLNGKSAQEDSTVPCFSTITPKLRKSGHRTARSRLA